MPIRGKAGKLAGLIGSDSEPDFDAFDANDVVVTKKAVKPRGPSAAKTAKPAPPRLSGGGVAKPAQRQALKERSANLTTEEAPSAKDTKPMKRSQKNALAMKAANVTANTKRARPAVKGSQEDVAEQQYVEEMEVDNELQTVPDDMQAFVEEMTQQLEEDDATSPDWSHSESELRRQLRDLTKKYESLESRHHDLRSIGVKEAEQNYERLRKQSDENTAASNKLIAQLKEEVASQTSHAREGDQLRLDFENSEARADSLQEKVDQLTRNLADARSEVRTLSTKLAASRNAEAQAQAQITAKVPGSAMKHNIPGVRAAAAQQTEAVQTAQMKEDLYGDLTGLIVRGLKRGSQEDVFDCIQTGRNGTLHFKLALESSESTANYADLQFTYRPQLDEDRDAEMMDLLPDYLTEEITFPRPQAAKFYARVTKSLTERQN